MAKTIVGIDIGANLLKFSACAGGAVQRLAAVETPDNLVREGRIISYEAMSAFIKQSATKAKIVGRSCAVVLPSSVVFTRTMTVPLMTREQLKLNLPFEFRDYITQEKDKYFFDYAVMDTVLDEQENPQELELIAAAALKETVKEYSDMLRKAGFKLLTAIPEELSYMNVIRRLGKEAGGREYCFIDLGHTSTRLHIYKGLKLQATRAMELSVSMLDMAIAEKFGVDEHIARLRKHANTNGELSDEVCANIYTLISIEIMRAINFYRFNSPDNALDEVYLGGGGAKIEPLVKQLESSLDIPLRRLDSLLPDSGGDDNAILCAAAVGATLQ